MKRMGVRDGGAQSGGATLSGAAQGEAKLLVVEDDPNILELLSASLRFAGFSVSTATSGTKAVQVAREDRPDLIVLDVMLPDLDGFEVIRKLRDGGTRTPVVFLTARDATDEKIRGLTLGGDDSIVESYISYLRRKVDSVEPRLIHTLRGVGYVLRLPA